MREGGRWKGERKEEERKEEQKRRKERRERGKEKCLILGGKGAVLSKPPLNSQKHLYPGGWVELQPWSQANLEPKIEQSGEQTLEALQPSHWREQGHQWVLLALSIWADFLSAACLSF